MAHRTDLPRIREDDPTGKDIPTCRRTGVPEGIRRMQSGPFIGADPAHGAGARTAPGLR
ncbi:hypothetical protein ACI2S5_10200 [Ralstonia nicotianae]|uniref:hypothetical protein n=1 Tax=Ralstonia pseudosolanacearum TaxID=1310165 RepID=UPI0002C07FAE|nr:MULTISPECIES: hypothetical protein [Ralstonia]ANH32083.1 hypothetical protein A3768_0911 [Ralstonia solanacearum]AGH85103.1 hypothetical protein F504_2591 [Ralstonia pseudosolanacearum FQY_4]MDO3517068.1 hypothetical protein [Ralstonia pseudosolanacearum]MDO3541849.1 hypothetical protein [Ralstonia pseudosolanacearum]QKL51185.1 hypothetical protein HI816_04595 [Ralstonia solanacearum]